MMSAHDRISEIVQKWFLVEPLLFAVWTSHELRINPRIQTIRVGNGRIEYNPEFVDELKARTLQHVMELEALRIVLKHPYQRRQDQATLHYAASNLTIREHLNSDLPIPQACEYFGHHDWDKQYLEFYYARLLEMTPPDASPDVASGGEPPDDPNRSDQASQPVPVQLKGTQNVREDLEGDAGDPLVTYSNPETVGPENTAEWEEDELVQDEINQQIRTAEEMAKWGSTAGRLRETILATLRPKMNYRAVLRLFRASVLSVQRRLTRMKPNRRYGFQFQGSRYDFTTKLLFAIDVSGSVSRDALQRGFSAVNQLFKYGISSIDVLQFDTEVQGDVLSIKRARYELKVTGRGGTDFSAVIRYLDAHPEYDGLIIYTDGAAAIPQPPSTRGIRLLWLFHSKRAYEMYAGPLQHLGMTTFLQE